MTADRDAVDLELGHLGRAFAMNAPAAENPGKSIADRLIYWLVVSVQRDGKRKTTAENINLCDIFTAAGFNGMLVDYYPAAY
ncbi:hypothetical protein [Burkholderia gladioli]|uniref:hypothetical protein n=1 Tax=Burkholderia gladioli TaxID=28095 RepID=UPI00164073EA|nr:hypothetical protein [Burkholderia gladioli]